MDGTGEVYANDTLGAVDTACACGGGYNRRVLDQALRDRVMHRIWPRGDAGTSSVWAVLDAARDERIYPALRTSGLDYLCLYSGRLSASLERAAPYLVELAPTYRFASRLIETSWGQSWGVFLRMDDSSNLRHHLRSFLRVRDDSDRSLIFRYYDPRVLRIFLPTCRRDELAAVFGPIRSYLMESESGDSLLEFSFAGETLHQHRTALTAGGVTPAQPT
jgi:hypothetical protein